MKNKIIILFWIITFFCSYSIFASELHKAAAAGDIKKLKMLLSKGEDINKIETINNRDEEGDHKFQGTPLHWAINAGQDNAVMFLVKKGADVNAVGIYTDCCETEKVVPLDMAVVKRNKKIANLLLQSGANVEGVPGEEKDWPLAIAMEHGYYEIAQLLIDHGANIYRKGINNYNIIDYALSNGRVDSLKFLFSNRMDLNLTVREPLKETPLHIAASNCRIEVAQFLIDHGANLNSIDHDGSSPLHYVILSGRCAIDPDFRKPNILFIEFLLSKGADINLTDNNGNTPLHKAVDKNIKDYVEFLLKKGAKIDIKNILGKTPLMLAEEKGYKDIIDLLKKGEK
jgi:ankyrin repeat protein